MRLQEIPVRDVTERTPLTQTDRQNTPSRHDSIVPVMHPVDRSVNWSQSVDSPPEEEAVMQISGFWKDGLVITLWTSWWIRDLQ